MKHRATLTTGLVAGCLLALPTIATASPTKKSGTLEAGCQALGQVKLCFDPAREMDDLSFRVAGQPTHLLAVSSDAPVPFKVVPFEIAQHGSAYRVKVGAPSRSDIPFFAYWEVGFRKVSKGYRVDRYVLATDSECEGSPDIRMVYEFDLQSDTLTAILAPPWSNDGKVHRFKVAARLETADLFQLSDEDFIKLLDNPAFAAVQKLCSA